MTSLVDDNDGIAASERDISEYFDAVFAYPAAGGWVHGAYGVLPYLNENGKFRFTRFLPELAAWPAEADLLAHELAKCAAIADVYLCPYVLSGEEREKGTSVARPLVHCDGDDDVDLEKARTVPGVFVVGSGTPGHGHVYVMLTRSVSAHQHHILCKGLAYYLGAKNPKFSDNDVLRPPGTNNFKLRADDNDADPLPVTWLIRPTGERIDPEDLAELLGVELTDEPPPRKPKAKSRNKSGGNGSAVLFEVKQFDLLSFPKVRRALAKVTNDRSADTMRIVSTCARAGLTEANARWAVRQRQDLAGRLDCRRDDDVARCFGRAYEAED